MDYNQYPYTCQMGVGFWERLILSRTAAPPPSATTTAAGCPSGFEPGGTCPQNGPCCKASWSKTCGPECVRSQCEGAGGAWVVVDYNSNPYTCQMRTGLDCPSGFEPGGACTQRGLCCQASWSESCSQGCAQAKCKDTGGAWIVVDYNHHPYTCQMAGSQSP